MPKATSEGCEKPLSVACCGVGISAIILVIVVARTPWSSEYEHARREAVQNYVPMMLSKDVEVLKAERHESK